MPLVKQLPLASFQLGDFLPQRQLQFINQRCGLLIRRDLRIDRQPHLPGDADQLIMRQDKIGRRIDRPCIVGCKITAKGKSAKQARRCQWMAAAQHIRPRKQFANLAGDFGITILAPGHEFNGRAGAGKGHAVIAIFPVITGAASGRLQEPGKADAAARNAVTKQALITLLDFGCCQCSCVD